MKRTLMISCQGKGGCGKSHSAFLVTSWAIHHNIPYIGLDTDSSNATYGDFSAFNVKSVETMDEDGLEIKPEKWDTLAYFLLENMKDERLCIVDIGASQFQSFVSYCINSQIMPLLQEKFNIYLNIPIVGGEALSDTLNGMEYLVELFGDNTKIVVWANEFFGKLIDEHGNS